MFFSKDSVVYVFLTFLFSFAQLFFNSSKGLQCHRQHGGGAQDGQRLNFSCGKQVGFTSGEVTSVAQNVCFFYLVLFLFVMVSMVLFAQLLVCGKKKTCFF